MKKVFSIACALIMILSSAAIAREAVGHISTSDPYAKSISPIVTYYMPAEKEDSLLIKTPEQLLIFFESKGVNVEALKAETLPVVLKDALCAICVDCCDEFQEVLHDIVVEYTDSNQDEFIVQVGDVYWSFSV